VTGLVRDKRLRNYMIWRRIKAREMVQKASGRRLTV